MEADIVVVYYEMSVDCSSLKILCYIRIIAARSHPTVA